MCKIKVSIVIVNYNGGELIQSCIESVVRETKKDMYEIIVVDNNSSDGSNDAIKELFPFVNIINLDKNIGFGSANNIGFGVVKGEYILLLNPDTQIKDRAIEKSVAYAQEHPEIGVLGCKVLWDSGERQSTLIKFPTLRDIVINSFVPNVFMRKSRLLGKSRYIGMNFDCEQDVDIVAGCFMMLHHTVLDDVGGFDEDFFMFGEEVEWCWRIYQTGRKIRYYPRGTIIHHGGGCSSSLSFRKALLIAKGQLMVFQKTRSTSVSIIANLLMLLRDAPRVIIWSLLRLIVKETANQNISLKTSYIRFVYLFYYLIGFEKKI